jgi:regulator of nonsense transcripts 2
MENEIKANLSKTNPKLLEQAEQFVTKMASSTSDQTNLIDSLHTIKEDEEEVVVQKSDDSYYEDSDSYPHDSNDKIKRTEENRDKRQRGESNNSYDSTAEDEDDDNYEEDNYDDDDYEDDENENDDDEEDDNDEDNDEEAALVHHKANEITKEDEDFMKAFDSLVSENIAQRTKEAVKMPNVDIAVPMHLSKLRVSNQLNSASNDDKKSGFVNELKGLKPDTVEPKVKSEEEEEEEDETPKANSSNKKIFPFVIMMKKGNKPQFHDMQVPLNSDFANQFIARGETEKAEKEKLKRLTLNINERIEQEELQKEIMQGINQQTSRNATNRSQHYYHHSHPTHHQQQQQKYNHQKGVPNVDAIFGVNSGTKKK